MSTCPDCAEPIRDRDLAGAVLPMWVAYPACTTTLVGGRFIQIVSVAMALAAGAVLLVTLVLLLVSGPDIGGPLFAAFLVLVIWLVGLFLIDRFGSYVVWESGPGPTLGVGRYLLAVGLVSIALLSVAVAVRGLRGGAGTVGAIVLTPFLLLYPRYVGRLGHRILKPVTVVLLVWAGMVVVSAGVFALFGVINFPKKEAFEEQLALEPRPQSEHDAWDELVALTRDEGADEETLLEFFAQNVVSVPDGSFNFDTEVPRVTRLAGIATSELEKVAELMERGDGPAANERYVRLWTAADNMVTGNVTLIQHLVGLGYVGTLISYYLDGNSKALRPSVPEVERLSASIDSKLEDCFVNGMVAEYLSFRNTLLELRGRSVCALADVEPTSCAWGIGWPFYDEHKTQRKYHDFFFKTIELSRQPFYAAERDAAFADVEERYPEGYSFGDIWTNPFGTALLRVITPLVSPFSSSKDFTRARLSAFRFVLEATATGNLDSLVKTRFEEVPAL